MSYLQDGLKLLVYVIPLVYVLIKKKSLKIRYFCPLVIGLSLLVFGHLLDFFDEFKCLDRIFIIGDNTCHFHDLFEDSVGFTLGFVIFILAIYLEFCSKNREKMEEKSK